MKMMRRYLYIITNGELYKIGVTDNPKRRIDGLGTQGGKELTVVHIEDMGNASVFERHLHAIFNDRRQAGEWFKLSEDDIRRATEYMKLFGSGFVKPHKTARRHTHFSHDQLVVPARDYYEYKSFDLKATETYIKMNQRMQWMLTYMVRPYLAAMFAIGVGFFLWLFVRHVVMGLPLVIPWVAH